jgi:hypothetical protein
MKVEEHRELERVIAEAQRIAKKDAILMVVYIDLYAEQGQSFNYCPAAGINILTRPSHYALIGTANSRGSFTHAGEVFGK